MNNKSEELLAINPYGKVPVLVVDNQAIYESAVIGEYLEEVYPEVQLMPKTPYNRAQVRIWTDYAASRFAPPFYHIMRSENPEKVKKNWSLVHKELAYVENHLKSAKTGWFVGGAFGMADINMLPFIDRADNLEGEILTGYPSIKSWLEAFRKRLSYQETVMPD